MRQHCQPVLALVVIATAAVCGCASRAAVAPQEGIAVGGGVSGAVSAVSSPWIGFYSGLGDLYLEDSGWSRGGRAQIYIRDAGGDGPIRVHLHGMVHRDNLVNYGFGFEVTAEDSVALRGERSVPGHTYRYELERTADHIEGAVRIWNEPTAGHPKAIYTFDVSR